MGGGGAQRFDYDSRFFGWFGERVRGERGMAVRVVTNSRVFDSTRIFSGY
jgi:hypothetical protein